MCLFDSQEEEDQTTASCTRRGGRLKTQTAGKTAERASAKMGRCPGAALLNLCINASRSTKKEEMNTKGTSLEANQPSDDSNSHKRSGQGGRVQHKKKLPRPKRVKEKEKEGRAPTGRGSRCRGGHRYGPTPGRDSLYKPARLLRGETSPQENASKVAKKKGRNFNGSFTLAVLLESKSLQVEIFYAGQEKSARADTKIKQQCGCGQKKSIFGGSGV